ncbi:hypothetical protein Tco_1048210, partial [Tanacetum coccineum]
LACSGYKEDGPEVQKEAGRKKSKPAVVLVDVPFETTGVTGCKHRCSGAVSSDQKKKVQGCSDVRENGRKGSVKAGGFGFGSLAVERKRYKRVALFSWSVERPLGTSFDREKVQAVKIRRDWRRTRCDIMALEFNRVALDVAESLVRVKAAEDGGVMVFSVGRCHGEVPVEMTGVTGDKHLCSGTVSSDQKKKVQGCSDVSCGFTQLLYNGDNSRMFLQVALDFVRLAVERKRYKRVALFSWSVERPLETSFDREKVQAVKIRRDWRRTRCDIMALEFNRVALDVAEVRSLIR